MIDEFNDVLKVQGRMTMGYGIVPKMAMQDKRLTIEAKAIYSYFCSYAGAGTTAFPSRDKIVYDLQLGVKRYYTHFNLLKDCGYIQVEQKIDSKGKFKSNLYTLVEMIDLSAPCSQNDHTEKSTEKPCGRFAYTGHAYTDNDHTNNNSIKINNINNIISNPILSNQNEDIEKEKSDSMGLDKINNQLNTQLTEKRQKNKEGFKNTTMTSDKHSKKPSTTNYNYTQIEEKIKTQIDYNYLIEDRQTTKETIDEILFTIVSTICTNYKDGYISMGEERIPEEMVRSVFFKLSYEHIEYFIDCFNRQTETITKLSPYIRKSLYYNYGTVSHHYTNQVHHDMPQLAERKE